MKERSSQITQITQISLRKTNRSKVNLRNLWMVFLLLTGHGWDSTFVQSRVPRQFTKRRNCTLIAKPMAMKVAIRTPGRRSLTARNTNDRQDAQRHADVDEDLKGKPPTTAMITSMPMRSDERRAPVISRESRIT